MSLTDTYQITARAQQAVTTLTPQIMAPPMPQNGARVAIAVTIGPVAIRTFSTRDEAQAYCDRLSAALAPFRQEIEIEALEAIKAAIAAS